MACQRFNRSPLQLTGSQIRQLQNYDWPGNVRELQNVIERAVIRARLGSLTFDILQGAEAQPPAEARADRESVAGNEIVTEEEMRRRERENIAAALKQSKGRIYGPGGAAQLLGMKPTTLSARVKKLQASRSPTSRARVVSHGVWKESSPPRANTSKASSLVATRSIIASRIFGFRGGFIPHNPRLGPDQDLATIRGEPSSDKPARLDFAR